MKNNFTNLRIVSGSLKGREILAPKDEKTHPMGSRERLALLNMIGPAVEDATILDAFAGTGAIGIEALSRGAKKVVFTEKDRKTAEILNQNLENLGLKEKAEIMVEKVEKSSFENLSGDEFDFVIADPPYDKLEEIRKETFNDLLKLSKKLFILSHPENFNLDFIEGKLLSTKKYAAARLSTFTF